mmetsp:Transcript_13931/g.33109  ORF Transcript_13931/g.33109 Transcript_13931/m.33109 type:complete len:218 (-) Transcript_13931:816-1469(-)
MDACSSAQNCRSNLGLCNLFISTILHFSALIVSKKICSMHEVSCSVSGASGVCRIVRQTPRSSPSFCLPRVILVGSGDGVLLKLASSGELSSPMLLGLLSDVATLLPAGLVGESGDPTTRTEYSCLFTFKAGEVRESPRGAMGQLAQHASTSGAASELALSARLLGGVWLLPLGVMSIGIEPDKSFRPPSLPFFSRVALFMRGAMAGAFRRMSAAVE